MGNKHDKTPMSAADLDRIATSLAYFAQRYREVAAQMKTSNIAELEVTGIKTLNKTTLPFLQGAVSSATTALDRAILKPVERKGPIHLLTAAERKAFLKQQEEKSEREHAQAPKERRTKGAGK